MILLVQYAILILFFAFWELGARLGWIDPFIVSSPSRVLQTFCSLYKDGSLFQHIGITLYETGRGFMTFGDVMDEVGGRWGTMTEAQQRYIAT